MSHYLSPVLGDHIYSRRTQLIRGTPFVVSAHASFPGPQVNLALYARVGQFCEAGIILVVIFVWLHWELYHDQCLVRRAFC